MFSVQQTHFFTLFLFICLLRSFISHLHKQPTSISLHRVGVRLHPSEMLRVKWGSSLGIVSQWFHGSKRQEEKKINMKIGTRGGTETEIQHLTGVCRDHLSICLSHTHTHKMWVNSSSTLLLAITAEGHTSAEGLSSRKKSLDLM